MKKSLIVLRHEFWLAVRNRSFVILTLALPLLAFLGFGIYEGVQHWSHPATPQDVKIGYVDQTGMFDEYTAQTGVTFVLYGTEEKAKDALLADTIQDYLVIPSDYVTTGVITRYTLSRDVQLSAGAAAAVKDFLLSNMLAGQVSPQLLERAETPMLPVSVRLDKTGETAPQQDIASSYFVPLIFGMLFIISIFFSSGFLFQSVTEEKENRVMEVLLSSVSSTQLLVGKVLGLGAAGLLQIGVWLITVKVFVEVASGSIPVLGALSIPASLLGWCIVYFILGYLLFAALYAGVGSIGATAREGQGWSTIFALPAVAPLWFSYLLLTNPESALARGLTFFPLTAPVTAMVRLSIHAMSAWEIAVSLAILAASVALTMWVSAKAFRVFSLMYGKRPAVREILRYIRES
jgi:ABC-2 type transport system permease protein